MHRFPFNLTAKPLYERRKEHSAYFCNTSILHEQACAPLCWNRSFLSHAARTGRRPSQTLRRRAYSPAGELAAHGILRIHPLWPEHLYRQGMGIRRRKPANFQPHGLQRLRDRGNLQERRHEGHDLHGQAPRRLLRLAHQVHGAQHHENPVEKRQGGCGQGIRPGLQEARHQIRHLPQPVGPQPRRIRQGRLPESLLPANPGTSEQLRPRV